MSDVKLVVRGSLEDDAAAFIDAWHRTECGEGVHEQALIEADALNSSNVTIPAQHWDAFKAWLNRPAETIPALLELARRASIQDEDT